jgi:serine/threonine protein kinase
VSKATDRNLGKYEILEEIGRGGFGTVYKAMDTTLERIVALKILRSELLHDPVFIQRFEAEAKMAAQLEHPNIVRVYEVGKYQGTRYLAMEYVDGQSLAEILQVRGQLTTQQAQKITQDVAAALDLAHRKGMIHRDIKPSNILIRNDGTVLLTDFGLAKAVAASFAASLTSTGQILGTLRYMSPEQAEEKPLDHRADLYSLGIVLYEMLAGRPPFMGDTAIQMIRAHADMDPPLPSQYNKAITPAVESVILRSLAKNPDQRYPSAGQLARALERAVTRGVVGKPPPVRREPEGAPRRRRFLPVFAGLALVVCIISIGSAWLLREAWWSTPMPTAMVQVTATTEQPTPTWTDIAPTDPATPAHSPTTTVTDTPEPTATNTPSNTETPTRTPVPSRTPTHTPTTAPTDMPAPTDSPLPDGAMAPGWTIQTQQGTVSGGNGRLEIALFLGDGSPITDKYLEVFHQRRDLASQWVTDGGDIAWSRTDNTGLVAFDLAPGSYIVRADFTGYNWGDASDVEGKADVPVEAGKITRLTIRLNRLIVGFRYGDGTPIRDQYLEIYEQKQDLAGNWVTDGGEAAWGRTDNTGTAVFDLAPGPYIVAASFKGYNWGDAYDTMGKANVRAASGQETILIQDLGLLSVGLLDASNQPRQEVYVAVYKQRRDAGGSWTLDGNEVAWGRTDNRGVILFHLTPGLYVVELDDQETYGVPVEAGRITTGDGKSFSVQE